MSRAADYITDYLSRNAPSFMAAPWKHMSPVVRALWHGQNAELAAKEMADAPKPSDEYDRASDAMNRELAKREEVLRDAWATRRLERLSDAPMTLTHTREHRKEMEHEHA